MNKKEFFKFSWRVIVAHVVAYFVAGLLAFNFLRYDTLFETGTMKLLMKPTTDPLVAFGTFLQIIRGGIMALVLFPFRKVFLNEKYGFIKLGILILGLSVLSTFAAASGSLDGFIYTKMSFAEQIIGYPEAIIWISLFVTILWSFYKFERKALKITMAVVFILICLMSIAGYLTTLQQV
jgi:hypothetical protein